MLNSKLDLISSLGDNGNMHDQQLLTLSEVAEYLRVAEKTVLRMIARNEIPCVKVANQWRFIKSVIDDWLLARMNVVPQNDLAAVLSSPEGIIPLRRLINENLVVPNMRPAPKEEILRQLIQPLVELEIVTDPEDFLHKLMLREKMTSTALGRGIAIPHLRHPRENPGGGAHLVMGLCPEGTDFKSHDGGKTHVFFLLVSDSETLHLRVLAKLNAIFHGNGLSLKLCQMQPKEALEELFKAESSLPSP